MAALSIVLQRLLRLHGLLLLVRLLLTLSLQRFNLAVLSIFLQRLLRRVLILARRDDRLSGNLLLMLLLLLV